jgi:3',5'-cyclic AMP phosphodiesterase CpdA
MKLTWLTDVHLNFLPLSAVDRFLQCVAETPSDAVVITGDIGEAPDVVRYLEAVASAVLRPVYFVLGNHDFYRGSIAGVRAAARELSEDSLDLRWLPAAGVVPLTSDTCLVGHDGWGDGRYGDYANSRVSLSDWSLIHDLSYCSKYERLDLLHKLGDEAADYLRTVLPAALAQFGHIIVATHVPPFREACWHEGRISDEDWLPHFTCKAVGDVLVEFMMAHPYRTMTVLCGHTHSSGEVEVLPNLRVSTGGAGYGKPTLQRVIEVR